MAKNKTFYIKLKNGIMLHLNQQDVLNNDIEKLYKQVPDIRLKKTNSKYYKLLIFFSLFYILTVQCLAYFLYPLSFVPMLFITFWGVGSIISIYLNIFSRKITLQKILQGDSLDFLFNPIIFAGIILISLIFALSTIEGLCDNISWLDILNVLIMKSSKQVIYFEFMFVVSFWVLFLLSFCKFNGLYQIYKFRYLCGKITIFSHLFSVCILMLLLFFAPKFISKLVCSIGEMEFVKFLCSITPALLFYVTIPNIMFFLKSILIRDKIF